MKGNVASAQRGYAALNAAYESGDVEDLRPFADELWDPDIVLSAALSDGREGGVEAGARLPE